MKDATPVYPYSAAYAREHGELDAYRTSHKANVACKQAIEAAIREHYRDNSLGREGAQQVIEQFGLERVQYVLANTVRQMDWDGRISPDNKAWARNISVYEDKNHWGDDRNLDFVVASHPGLTDLFTTQVRREAKELEAQKDRKPSVLKKLREVPAEPNAKSAPGRSRETER